MDLAQLCKHFGSASKAATALNMHRQRVSRWKEGIPLEVQLEIEVSTEGALKADISPEVRALLAPKRRKVAA